MSLCLLAQQPQKRNIYIYINNYKKQRRQYEGHTQYHMHNQGQYCGPSTASEIFLFSLPNYIHVYAIIMKCFHIVTRVKSRNRLGILQPPILCTFHIRYIIIENMLRKMYLIFWIDEFVD